MALSADPRNLLAATVKAARRVGESGAGKALGKLAVGDARAHGSMSSAEQDLRRRLRAHGRQLGDRHDPATGVQAIDRLAHEVAYEHWHRQPRASAARRPSVVLGLPRRRNVGGAHGFSGWPGLRR